MIERHFTLGAEGKLLKSVLRYAIFGSAVEALHYEFIQREPAPAADRPVFQSITEYAVFLSASETTDNKVSLEHSDSGSCLLVDRLRPLHNIPFCPISASVSNFNPRVVKILAFLELEQN